MMKHKDIKIHLAEVGALQHSLKEKKGSFSLKTNAASNTLRNSGYKKHHNHLDLSSFTAYLEFNPQEKWIIVEPRVTFASLCRFTLSMGLIPPVVPEFPHITVGGAILGAALESSSHQYGQVSDQCLEYEVLLGNGEKVVASPEENPDLFYALSGSYGTLGVLTAIKLKLIASKPFVHLHYHWYDQPKDLVDDLRAPSTSDFVEGVILSPSKGVVIKGDMVDVAPGHVHRQRFPWSPWFVGHLLEKPHDTYMKLEEYLFRYDRGAFWIGRYILSLPTIMRLLLRLGIPKPRTYPLKPSLFLRLLFGWTFSSQKLFRIWHRVPNGVSEKIFLIHDFYTPPDQTLNFLNRSMELTSIFPIWLCPIKGTKTGQLLSPHFGQEHFINIGLYGIPKKGDPMPLSDQLETEIVACGGRKMLYSFTYYDEATFNSVYCGDQYEAIRKKYYASPSFPSLFQKIRQIKKDADN